MVNARLGSRGLGQVQVGDATAFEKAYRFLTVTVGRRDALNGHIRRQLFSCKLTGRSPL